MLTTCLGPVPAAHPRVAAEPELDELDGTGLHLGQAVTVPVIGAVGVVAGGTPGWMVRVRVTSGVCAAVILVPHQLVMPAGGAR